MSDPVQDARDQYKRRKGHQAANAARLAGDPLAKAELVEDWQPVIDVQRSGPFLHVPDADDDEIRDRQRQKERRRAP